MANEFKIKGTWDEIKGKLKQKFLNLTENDTTSLEKSECNVISEVKNNIKKNEVKLTES